MISTAATLFYGRRSRPTRTSLHDLTLDSDSDSGPQINHRHRKRNHHRRYRRNNHNLDESDRSRRPSSVLLPFNPSPLTVSEPPQGCVGESPSLNIIPEDATHGLSRRYGGSNRLPGSVLLARERLIQRLRGESASGVRYSGESSASGLRDDVDWGTGVSGEQPASGTVLTELHAGANLQSVSRKPNNKPLGLSVETISQLHHEVFLEPQKCINNSLSKTSKDCSICLENFVEGNELINLHCGHRFHANCLYPWVQSCGECPYCRSCIVATS